MPLSEFQKVLSELKILILLMIMPINFCYTFSKFEIQFWKFSKFRLYCEDQICSLENQIIISEYHF